MLTVTKDLTMTEKHAWEKIIVENGTLTFEAEGYARQVEVKGGCITVKSHFLQVTRDLPIIPVKSALVQIYDYNTGELIDEKYTDEDGNAVFNLPSGTYKVVVTKTDYEKHEQVFEVTESRTKVVELEYTPDPR